ncbi:MAG: glycosyltransferase [Candidatus Electrothrix sp. MAN1_4]|nr:glycosyltransferase [Candidatus Electrothrix sp. MAN1_4]
MNVLIINASDIQGGAARSAYRLHRALLAEGIDSNMLVQRKDSDDYTVIGPDEQIQKGLGRIRPTLDTLPIRLYRNRTKTLFSPSWLPFSPIVRRINEIKPDLVHLHWIAGGMLRIEDIAKIKRPIVWSLHDDWAFTGGCHIKWDCKKYKENCRSCQVLGSKIDRDLSQKIYRRKQKVFPKIEKLAIVGLSRWLMNCAKQSSLLRNIPVINLPNLISTDIFSPFPKEVAKDLLTLPKNKKIMLCGAINVCADVNKGFKYLSSALQKLNTEDVELVLFGSTKPRTPQAFKQPVRYLGHLHDDISLRVLYSAADVMVVPSLQENLSNAIMESLACGTPVVAFDVGGNSDLIEHQKTGYLATPFDADELACGIDWVLTTENYSELSTNSRNKVLREFDSPFVARRYIQLYQDMLAGDVQ